MRAPALARIYRSSMQPVRIAVLVAALAGIVFIVTNNGWAIVAFVVIEAALAVLHFVFVTRIVRG
jgi:hypothetical protein